MTAPMSFTQLPPLANAAVFAGSAGLVWFAGSRLAAYADALARITGLGQAFAGMLLLGGVTSLPEIATVGSASLFGDPVLAVNSLLGSSATNILLMAVADAVVGQVALTGLVTAPSTLFQGTLCMMVLGGTATVCVTGDIPIPDVGIGLGSTLLLVACAAALWLSSHYEGTRAWAVDGHRPGAGERAIDSGRPDETRTALLLKMAAVSAAILVGGALLSESGSAIATQSGLGSGLVGMVLVALATSLPELSSIVAALRLNRYEMAVGDLFGANLFNISLLFLADALHHGGPILAKSSRFEATASLMAMLMSGVFLLGLLKRQRRTVLRMGYDSLAALLLYVAGLAILYPLAS